VFSSLAQKATLRACGRGESVKIRTVKQIKAEMARYPKYVEWSDEDQCFIGRCPTLFSGGVHGSKEAEVYVELCQTVAEWVELLHKDEAGTN
jgi:predicted RNase H-like HicB family nuclease